MQTGAVKHIRITRVNENGILETDEQLAVEEPLEIRMMYGSAGNRVTKIISVTMRTPGNDGELAIGFLFTEGIINDKNQVAKIQSDNEENKVMVILCDTTA